jgi:hypothetical protein
MSDEPTRREVERRMRPGAFSSLGFLGPNEELSTVLRSDDRAVQRLGLHHDGLADALERLIRPAVESPGRIASADDYVVQVMAFTGFQICPFARDPDHQQCSLGGGARYASVDWSIEDRRTSAELSGPGLVIHLIRGHHFYGGRASPYRVDPTALARLLRLAR